MKLESEAPKTELKMAGKFTAEDLDEKLIAEVEKQVGGVQGYYPTNKTADAMEGIMKTPFTLEIEKEERPKDFNLPLLDKYEGVGDPMAHLLHYKQRISMERVIEALNCKLFATTLSGKALSWFCQLLEGFITNFTSFGRKFREQYHNYRLQQRSMADLYMEQCYNETTRDYLTRFMDLTSQIFDIDLKQATNLFVRGLVKGLHMGERIANAKKILRVFAIRPGRAKS